MIADMGSRDEFTQNTKMRNDEMTIGTVVARMDLYKRKNITDILFQEGTQDASDDNGDLGFGGEDGKGFVTFADTIYLASFYTYQLSICLFL